MLCRLGWGGGAGHECGRGALGTGTVVPPCCVPPVLWAKSSVPPGGSTEQRWRRNVIPAIKTGGYVGDCSFLFNGDVKHGD